MRKCIPDGIDLHGYADEYALYFNFPEGSRRLELLLTHLLKDTLKRIKTWVDDNRINMSELKTEFIQVKSRQQLKKCSTQHLTITDCPISKIADINYLGAY